MLYAAYGSNLHPVRLRARIPAARPVTTHLLDGRSLAFHKRGRDGSGKCSLVPGGAGAHVAIYEIGEDDKRILDAIEGLGCGYREEILDLPGIGQCATYVAEAAYVDDSLRPYDWYRELVLLGAAAQRFPREYLERISGVATVEDPDPERAHEHRDLIARIRNGG